MTDLKRQSAAPMPKKAILGAGIFFLVAGTLAMVGILSRIHAAHVLADDTTKQAAPTVTALPAAAGSPVSSLTLPGNVNAYSDSPIYARTSGYLTRWYYDIGSHVKKGALLATISSPEVDQQLSQAEADLATAEANAKNARTQADRYSALVKSDAVTRQDTDTYVNQANALAATVRSVKANLDRLRQLVAFEKVYAPFDGVITARTVDNGQLIDSGSAKELFHIQANQTLRVYGYIPQLYSASVHRGDKIPVSFAEHANQNYTGTLVRTADAIDPVSRTLLVEVDLDNKSGELLPGALAQLHFKTTASVPTLVIPAAALLFRKEGMRVGVVQNGRAHLVPVTIGEDDGATVQIVRGLNPSDAVIQDPPDSLIEGEAVHVVLPSATNEGSR